MKRWSTDEEEFLIRNYLSLGPIECAKHLGRTCSAVTAKAHKSGLTKENLWSEDDINFLIQNYSSLGAEKCAKHLGRTYEAISTKAYRLKLTKLTLPWSEQEEKFLIENYPNMGPAYCAEKLGNRTIHAVMTKAYMLDIQTNIRYNSNTVYVVYFPKVFLYKVGITSSIERRAKQFGQPCVILKTIEYETSEEAAEVERCLLKSVTLVNTGALNNGNTETFIQPSQEIKDFLGEKFSNL